MAYKRKPAKKSAAKKSTRKMAKTKKTARKTTRRRARVGAIGARGGFDIVGAVLAPVAGGILAQIVSGNILKNASPTIRNAAPIAAGIALHMFGGKSAVMRGLGTGMIVVGGGRLASNLLPASVAGMLPGSDAVAGLLPGSDAVAGTGSLDGSVVSGMPTVMRYGMREEASAAYAG